MGAHSRHVGINRGLIFISNVGKGCRIFTSESQRLEGFRRYLPEHGWSVRAIVKDCHCVPPEATLEGEFSLHAEGPESTSAWSTAIASHLEQSGSAGFIARVACAPRWWYRWWLHAAERTAWGFTNEASSREVLHLVHPLPALAGRIARPLSPGQKMATLPVKAAGLWVNRNHDQDRINWLERATLAGTLIVDQGAASVIVGSFPPVQNLEAAALIASRTGLPWIADFRDSVRGGWCCGPEMAPRVRDVVRSASAVLYSLEEFAGEDADIRCGKPYIVVENGFLDEEIDRARKQAPAFAGAGFTLRFLGTLYPMRNLDLFLAGMKLALEAPEGRELRFEYYGPTLPAAREVCDRLGVAAHCGLYGPVGREEALALTASATALVLPTNTVGHPGMPGAKLYEYLGVRQPILAAGGRDAYVERVLSATGAGVSCHSPEEVCRVLLDWIRQHRAEGSLRLEVNEPEIHRFSRRASAGRLASMLETVVGKG